MDSESVNTVWMGLGRAIGGSIIFSVPIMMTMEMWQIGFYVSPLRLLCLIALSLPLFYRISTMIGFRKSKTFWDNVIDVAVSYAVAFITTGIVLLTLGIITLDMDSGAVFSMLLLQAVPGSLGALLARHIVGESSDVEEEDEDDYNGDLTILATGALFLAFNLAPTEEMMLISYKMTTVHVMALLVLTLLVMHAFVVATSNFTVKQLQCGATHRALFVRITSVGYALALAVSFFMLWVFASIDDVSFHNTLKVTLVLSFPAGIGAAASRLIL